MPGCQKKGKLIRAVCVHPTSLHLHGTMQLLPCFFAKHVHRRGWQARNREVHENWP